MQKSLFYDNVRDFQGFNAVNIDIQKTLTDLSTNNRFGLLNNGITIVTKSINKVGSMFNIKDFQIVNGCQTSHVIHLNRNNIPNIDQIFIPIKLIVTDDVEVTNDIIKATNWQTEVKKEAFESLYPFHKKLEEFYLNYDKERDRRIYYERRSKQYDNQLTVSIDIMESCWMRIKIEYSLKIILHFLITSVDTLYTHWKRHLLGRNWIAFIRNVNTIFCFS